MFQLRKPTQLDSRGVADTNILVQLYPVIIRSETWLMTAGFE